MKIKNIMLTSAIIVPFVGFTALTHADNTTSLTTKSNTNKMRQLTTEQQALFDQVKTILEKQKAGTTLTSDEQAILDKWEASKPTMGSPSQKGENKMQLSAEQQALFDQVKTILEKQKAGTTLTSDEQAILDKWEASKPTMGSGSQKGENKEKNETNEKKTTQNSKLSTAYKTKIEKTVTNFANNISSLDNDEQITKLNAFKTKIENVQTQLNAKNIGSSKKETYNNILNYMLEQIESKIDSIDTTESSDLDINSLIN